MRISSTVHYASRLLVKLALHVPATGPLSASELADSTGISVKFIEKIIRQLRSAGMVRSIRGAAGGHLLSIKPEDVTLGDVLRVVEGGVQPPCNGEADSPDAPCRCRIAWTAAAKALEDTLDRFTIADITLLCALDFAKGLMKYRPGDEGLGHLQAWRERRAERPALLAETW